MKIFFQNLKEKRTSAVFSILFGFSFTTLIYLTFLQRNYFSKTYLAFSVFIFMITTFLSFLFTENLLIRNYKKTSRTTIINIFISSFVLSLLILVNVNIKPAYFLLPETSLSIQTYSRNQENKPNSIKVNYIKNSLGYIHYSKLSYKADWQSSDNLIIIFPSKEYKITWNGHVGDLLIINFEPTEDDFYVDIKINDEINSFDLHSENSSDEISFIREYTIPLINKIPFILAFLFISTNLFLAFFLSQQFFNIKPSSIKEKEESGLFYILPLIFTCTLSLFIFYPGIMTNDSLGQWQQALTGNYVNWHPLMHTLLISLLINIWYSPAVLAITQIALLVIVYFVAIKIFIEYKVNRLVIWLVTLLFAFWPLTPLMAITLWKDVLYSISLLGFFLILIKIALTRGQWITESANWLFLVLVSLLTGFFRQNGIVVSVTILLFLPFIYKSARKKLVYALMIFSISSVIIAWPINNFLTNQDSDNSGQLSIILLPHIAAHIDNGTPLGKDETEYLNRLMPLDEWKYDCCYIGNISYSKLFNRNLYLNNFPVNLKLAASLFIKDPLVDIRHQFCASEMVWNFLNNKCAQKSTHGFRNISPGNETWIVPNPFGLKEASLIPKAVTPVISRLIPFGIFSNQLIPLLRPAFYSLLSIILIIATSIRQRNKYLLSTLLLLLSQLIPLLLINFAPSFRYQFGTCLIGIICIGIYFLPTNHNE